MRLITSLAAKAQVVVGWVFLSRDLFFACVALSTAVLGESCCGVVVMMTNAGLVAVVAAQLAVSLLQLCCMLLWVSVVSRVADLLCGQHPSMVVELLSRSGSLLLAADGGSAEERGSRRAGSFVLHKRERNY